MDVWANRIFVVLGRGGPLGASLSAVSPAPELFALSLFRLELPEHELFRRSKGDPEIGAETFSEEPVIVVLPISSRSHSP